MTNEEKEKMVQRVSNAAAIIKLVSGVANNAAWLVMMDGLDHAKRCRKYGYRAKHEFNRALEEWHRYTCTLKYAKENRMFHLADMSEDVRRKYGDISDSQFYEFWASVGGPAYMKTKPLITSLWNKHRLSLLSHHVDDADHVAWVLTASAAIELSVQMYDRALAQCHKEMDIPMYILHSIFDQFRLTRVLERWNDALKQLSPGSQYDLDELERRNIELGLTQLCDAWMEPDLLYRSTMQSVEDYDEVFASKGFQRKVLREIAEVEDATNEELNKIETTCQSENKKNETSL